MNTEKLKKMLLSYKEGRLSLEDMMQELRKLPYENLGFAMLDQHREIRLGFPEIIYGEGKTREQLVKIIRSLIGTGENILATRVAKEKADFVMTQIDNVEYHEEARILILQQSPIKKKASGTITVISAGTADIPVAEEAYLSAKFLGNNVKRLYDVGVAGIHRLLDNLEFLRQSTVLIVVAGMEGALPSVVGGLVGKPVIAVPTSVGYGAHFGGVAPLLSMLNSCAPGVTVVNIDNGFGAAFAATLINSIQPCHNTRDLPEVTGT